VSHSEHSVAIESFDWEFTGGSVSDISDIDLSADTTVTDLNGGSATAYHFSAVANHNDYGRFAGFTTHTAAAAAAAQPQTTKVIETVNTVESDESFDVDSFFADTHSALTLTTTTTTQDIVV